MTLTSKKKAFDIIDAAVSYGASRHCGVEVSVTDSEEFTARFANNRMTEHTNEGGACVSLRVLVEGRQARVATDDLTLRGIKAAIDLAIETAKAAPADKLMLALPRLSSRTQLVAPSGHFDPKLVGLTQADREAVVKSMLKVAETHKLNAAGMYSASSEMAAFGNSNDVRQFDRLTDWRSTITMTNRRGKSSGWASGNGYKLDLQAPQELAQIAAKKAVMGKNRIKARPGLWTVILEPAAVLDLLCFLWDEFTGTAHVDRTSSFTDEIGNKVLGANITLRDDVYHPLHSGFAFDDEGLVRKAVTLVDKGVICKPVMGRRMARALGKKLGRGFTSTGHGVMQPSGFDEEALNLVMEGGDSSIEEMVASVERALIVTRVWYIRPTDPNTSSVTGTTRDGLFLVQDGKIGPPVEDFRFNMGLLDLLNNVVALGKPVLTSGEETSYSAVVPPLMVTNFRMTGRI